MIIVAVANYVMWHTAHMVVSTLQNIIQKSMYLGG